MPRTLLVTNDFPPRPGGIQQFVHNLAVRSRPDSLVVYASTWQGADKFDAEQPFEVVRESTGVLLPTPAVARARRGAGPRARLRHRLVRRGRPLGLLADGLRRRAGVERRVAQTTATRSAGRAARARGAAARIGQGSTWRPT
jgi:phosphatidylinositol alpha-1,6-mannosyltransferase